MPLISKNPITVEGVEYPYFLVNFSFSPYNAPNGASVAMRLTPYREIDGSIEQLPDHSKAVSYLDVFKEAELDTEVAAAVEKIMDGLQGFITDKGL